MSQISSDMHHTVTACFWLCLSAVLQFTLMYAELICKELRCMRKLVHMVQMMMAQRHTVLARSQGHRSRCKVSIVH